MSILKFIDKSVNTYFACLPRRKPQGTEIKHVKLIAHRGAHSKKKHCIENTLEAFENALAQKCWGIEMDVHATQDGILVINHDPTLMRLWGVEKTIAALSFIELREQVPKIPTLSEIVARFGKKIHLFIELKAPFNAEPALFSALKPLQPEMDYHLLSLSEQTLSSLSLFNPSSCLLVAGHSNLQQFCDLSIQKNYGGVLGHYVLMNNKKVALLRFAKKKMGIGFIDSKYSLYRAIHHGFSWIFTNNVENIATCLEKLQL